VANSERIPVAREERGFVWQWIRCSRPNSSVLDKCYGCKAEYSVETTSRQRCDELELVEGVASAYDVTASGKAKP
jgi:hypothetical protein